MDLYFKRQKCSGCDGLRRRGNGMDLTESEDIKMRWQEYTEELYKKDLHDSDGVVTMV